MKDSGSDTPRPLPLLTGVDLIALVSFLPSYTCQICISGAGPGGIRFKKNSLHIQKVILSSIPSLRASEPAAKDETEGFRVVSAQVFLTSRSIYSEDQLSVLSTSGSFK